MADRGIIIVVDDIEANRAILGEMFADEYFIVEAENGEQAIRKIKEFGDGIAVILLDIVMPVRDGFGVLKYMADEHLDDVIPVVMITADMSSETLQRGYDNKVADIVSKPFNVNVVQRRVKNIIELYSHKRSLEKTVEEQMEALEKQFYELQVKNDELKEYQDAMTEALSNIVEFRNNESGGHVKRIKNYTEILARYVMREYPEYGLDYEKIKKITRASAMHDIGKISISDNILLKPGRLTEAEFEIMKTHTIIGCDIIENFDFIKEKEFYDYTYDICRHHHECIDGKGYPDHLKGDEISIAAQIVSIADVYDALVSKRCYKKAFAHEDAVDMIMNGECGAFSDKILHCFSLCLEEFRGVFMKQLNTIEQEAD